MFDVCIVTTIHGDFDNRVYQRQLNALADAGLKVCMVAPWDFSRRSRCDFDYVQTQMPQTRAARIRHSLRTYRAVRRVAAKAYIFHDPDFLPFGLRLHSVTGRPVIYDCHENIPEDIRYGKDWIPPLLRPVVSVGFRMIENFIVRRLGRAIVTVPHLERRYKALGADVQLVRNFPRFSVPQGFVCERAILYTGDLTRDYGVHNLVAIAREMKRRGVDAPLRIVDRFRDDEVMRQHVQQVITDENLNVEILRPVIAENMPNILAKGCIGLSPIPDLPNKVLAYPTKIFEYFMFGLAVIASDIAGTREVLDDGRLGILLPPDDTGRWVDEIEKLLTDEAYFRHYVDTAKAAVTDSYNWDKEEARLVNYVCRVTD